VTAVTGPNERADVVDAPRAGSARRVVIIAFFSNLAVSIAFGVAAVMTGSVSMFAQTVHAVADTANQAR
jgi:divalent metal cation (Fe/Co/Zn/Cd) transporter